MAQFGEILAELRQDRGLTQRELAKLFFVTPGTISNYEKGRHLPYAERLIKIADYFSVTTDYLLGRSSSNLPADVFSAPLLDDMTAGEMIQLVQTLSPDRKRLSISLLRDLHFGTVVGQYNHKEAK
ncbi:MAG: helix-turn-helix domain-containing protein [Clostridia bacterium]